MGKVPFYHCCSGCAGLSIQQLFWLRRRWWGFCTGFSSQESLRVVGPSTPQHDLTAPWRLYHCCDFMYSRKREWCVWLLIRFFCEIKNVSDFSMTSSESCLAWAFLVLTCVRALGFKLFMSGFGAHRKPSSCWMPFPCWMSWMICLDLLIRWNIETHLYLRITEC